MKVRKSSWLVLLGVMIACALMASKQQIVLSAQEELIVMTYNVFSNGLPDGLWGDRVDRILDIIEGVGPDILGLQEVWEWPLLEWPSISSVGSMLGMNHIIPCDLVTYDPATHRIAFPVSDLALYSQSRVIGGQTWPELFSRWSMRGRIQTPGGLMIDVIVVHIAGMGEQEGLHRQEIQRLGSILNEYADTPAMLIGDLNFFSGHMMSRFSNLTSFQEHVLSLSVLEETGWTEGAAGKIDQIWLSPALAEIAIMDTIFSDLPPYLPEDLEFRQLLSEASDHWPVVAKLVIEH